jgi:dihydrofolate synthase/folylpolyglutamate synthase
MAREDSYQNCLKTMYGLRRFGIKLGMSTIRKILKALDNPQNEFACIHVAGTNGKGSVASSLASILYRSGYRTGLYTSPHLVRFNERIQINGRPISNDHVVDAYNAVAGVPCGRREPTFFEFATAMALYEFGRQAVDWAVVETGMGGRLDATNVITPELSIITNVSLEHQAYLGNTLNQIAGEKAGIIKSRKPVITGIRQKKAYQVIEMVAAQKKAPLYRLGRDFKIRRRPSGTFSYYGRKSVWHNLQTALRGSHQADNAALVLAACELLNENRTDMALNNIKKGLSTNYWPGRLETVSKDPFILLDGAHNRAAADNLARYLAANLAGHPITLVIGILDDKPYETMLKSLLPLSSRVILTRAKIDRALDPHRLMEVVKNYNVESMIVSDVPLAVKHAVDIQPPNGVICVAGSLYVVGEAKEALDKGLLQGRMPSKTAIQI